MKELMIIQFFRFFLDNYKLFEIMRKDGTSTIITVVHVNNHLK